MDLIVKPTQRCNFKCDFCSSNKIDSSGNATLPLESIFSLLENNKIDTIIINGGDPLMMPPKYYWNLIKYLDEHDMDTSISFTSNLWDFYLQPEKWEKLFKHKRVGVTTSFQYGNERKLANGTVFNENLFRAVIEVFKERIGYVPMFIGVITENNEDKVLDTVRLAKNLGTACKLNPAVKSGRCKKNYPLWKAYQKYLEIIEAGLTQYEHNASALKDIINGNHNTCPYNRNCWRSIRSISPNGLIHSCGCFNDDHIINTELGDKTYCLSEYEDKDLLKDFKSLKEECFTCDLFSLCNSCFKQIHDIKQDHMEEDHCVHMKQIEQKLKSL